MGHMLTFVVSALTMLEDINNYHECFHVSAWSGLSEQRALAHLAKGRLNKKQKVRDSVLLQR